MPAVSARLRWLLTTFLSLYKSCARLVLRLRHALSGQQWGGVGLVTAGLGLELFGKFRKQQELMEQTAELEQQEQLAQPDQQVQWD